MPPIHSTPFKNIHNPSSLLALLRHTNPNDTTTTKKKKPSSSTTSSGGGLLKIFKLFPMLTSGCKMVALLAAGSRHQRRRIADHATIGTLFGSRRGRMNLAIQEDPHTPPFFVLELPILSSAFHKEMSSDILRIAFESENKTHKKKLAEEFVWAVYCNGRKTGYSIRRKQLSEDEVHVIHMLRGVSMGAGVLPSYDHDHKKSGDGDQVTYLRARFERVIGSKDLEALYMINPDSSDGPELSIFFVRGSFH